MPKAKEPKTPKPPIAQDPDRLSKGAQRVADRADARLCMQYLQDERFTGPAYWLEPSGKRVDREAAEELIRKRLFLPTQDGLFADASSQTFERAA